MISRMATQGWEIDSHTITHRDLTRLSAATVAYELKGSRDLLQRYFHVPVEFFCYPGGAYDAAVKAAVRRAGYLAATSVRYGLARPSELFALPRIVTKRTEAPTKRGRFAATPCGGCFASTAFATTCTLLGAACPGGDDAARL